MGDNWDCPMCDYSVRGGESHFYATGHDHEIQVLQGDLEQMNNAMTHIVIKHLMPMSAELEALKNAS